MALPFLLFVGGNRWEMLVAWLALSGAAILLEEQVTGPLILESGERDELLRGAEKDLAAEERRPGSSRTGDRPRD